MQKNNLIWSAIIVLAVPALTEFFYSTNSMNIVGGIINNPK